MFSVRLVTADSYQAKPVPQLDPTYSEFRGSDIKHVPVIRVFGSTPDGEKTCLHIHGVFPYLFVPYTGEENPEILAYRLTASLDAAINVSLGSASSNTQHVYSIQRVSGIPFYGYHRKEHQFLKIYFYNPVMIKRAADLLQNGSVLNQSLQPHEAHINYILQFMMDYNVHGMSLINLRGVKHRRHAQTLADLASSSSNRLSRENNDIVYLPRDVERQSTCELEIDALAADILNRLETDKKMDLNPGLAAIWEEERARRARAGLPGGDSQLVNPKSPPRPTFRPTDSDVYQEQRLARRLTFISQSDESTLSPATDRSVAYAAEVRGDENLMSSFRVPNSSVGPDEKSNFVGQDLLENMSILDSTTIRLSQGMSPDSSILGSDDMPLVDLLAQLARDSETNPESVDTDSLLGSQRTLIINDEKSDDEDVDDLNLTSLQLDSLDVVEAPLNSIDRDSNKNSMSNSPLISSWKTTPGSQNSADKEETRRNVDDFQLPQYDGAGDISPSAFINSDSGNAGNEENAIDTKNATANSSKINDDIDKSPKSRNNTNSPENATITLHAGDVWSNIPAEVEVYNKRSENCLFSRNLEDVESLDVENVSLAANSENYLGQYGAIGYGSFDRLLEIGSPGLEEMHSSMGVLLASSDSIKDDTICDSIDEEISIEAVLNGDPCFTESAELDKSDLTELHDQYVSLLGSDLVPDVHGDRENSVKRISITEEKSNKSSRDRKSPEFAMISQDSSSLLENVAPNIQKPAEQPNSKWNFVNDGLVNSQNYGESLARSSSENFDCNCNVVATWAELQSFQTLGKSERKRRFGGPRSIKRQNIRRRSLDKGVNRIFHEEQISRKKSLSCPGSPSRMLQKENSMEASTSSIFPASQNVVGSIIETENRSSLNCGFPGFKKLDQTNIGENIEHGPAVKKNLSHKNTDLDENVSVRSNIDDRLAPSRDIPSGVSSYSSEQAHKIQQNTSHQHCFLRSNKIEKVKFTNDDIWIIIKRKRGALPTHDRMCERHECKIPVISLRKVDRSKSLENVVDRKIKEETVEENLSNGTNDLKIDGLENSILGVTSIDESPKNPEFSLEKVSSRAKKSRKKHGVHALTETSTQKNVNTLPAVESQSTIEKSIIAEKTGENQENKIIEDSDNTSTELKTWKSSRNRRKSWKKLISDQETGNQQVEIPKTQTKYKWGNLPGIAGETTLEAPKKRTYSKKRFATSSPRDKNENTFKDSSIIANKIPYEALQVVSEFRTKNEKLSRNFPSSSVKISPLERTNQKHDKSSFSEQQKTNVTSARLKNGTIEDFFLPKNEESAGPKIKKESPEIPPFVPTSKTQETIEKTRKEEFDNKDAPPMRAKLPETVALNLLLKETKCRSTRTALKLLLQKRMNDRMLLKEKNKDSKSMIIPLKDTKNNFSKDEKSTKNSSVTETAIITKGLGSPPEKQEKNSKTNEEIPGKTDETSKIEPQIPEVQAKIIESENQKLNNTSAKRIINSPENQQSIENSATVSDNLNYSVNSQEASFETASDTSETMTADSGDASSEIMSLSNVTNICDPGDFENAALDAEFCSSVDENTSEMFNEANASVDESSAIDESSNIDELSSNATVKPSVYDTNRYENAVEEANFFAGKDYSIDAVSHEIPTCLFEEDSNSVDPQLADTITSLQENLTVDDTSNEANFHLRDLMDVYDVESLSPGSVVYTVHNPAKDCGSSEKSKEKYSSKIDEFENSMDTVVTVESSIEEFSPKSWVDHEETVDLLETSFEEESPAFEALSPQPRVAKISDKLIPEFGGKFGPVSTGNSIDYREVNSAQELLEFIEINREKILTNDVHLEIVSEPGIAIPTPEYLPHNFEAKEAISIYFPAANYPNIDDKKVSGSPKKKLETPIIDTPDESLDVPEKELQQICKAQKNLMADLKINKNSMNSEIPKRMEGSSCEKSKNDVSKDFPPTRRRKVESRLVSIQLADIDLSKIRAFLPKEFLEKLNANSTENSMRQSTVKLPNVSEESAGKPETIEKTGPKEKSFDGVEKAGKIVDTGSTVINKHRRTRTKTTEFARTPKRKSPRKCTEITPPGVSPRSKPMKSDVNESMMATINEVVRRWSDENTEDLKSTQNNRSISELPDKNLETQNRQQNPNPKIAISEEKCDKIEDKSTESRGEILLLEKKIVDENAVASSMRTKKRIRCPKTVETISQDVAPSQKIIDENTAPILENVKEFDRSRIMKPDEVSPKIVDTSSINRPTITFETKIDKQTRNIPKIRSRTFPGRCEKMCQTSKIFERSSTEGKEKPLANEKIYEIPSSTQRLQKKPTTEAIKCSIDVSLFAQTMKSVCLKNCIVTETSNESMLEKSTLPEEGAQECLDILSSVAGTEKTAENSHIMGDDTKKSREISSSPEKRDDDQSSSSKKPEIIEQPNERIKQKIESESPTSSKKRRRCVKNSESDESISPPSESKKIIESESSKDSSILESLSIEVPEGNNQLLTPRSSRSRSMKSIEIESSIELKKICQNAKNAEEDTICSANEQSQGILKENYSHIALKFDEKSTESQITASSAMDSQKLSSDRSRSPEDSSRFEAEAPKILQENISPKSEKASSFEQEQSSTPTKTTGFVRRKRKRRRRIVWMKKPKRVRSRKECDQIPNHNQEDSSPTETLAVSLPGKAQKPSNLSMETPKTRRNSKSTNTKNSRSLENNFIAASNEELKSENSNPGLNDADEKRTKLKVNPGDYVPRPFLLSQDGLEKPEKTNTAGAQRILRSASPQVEISKNRRKYQQLTPKIVKNLPLKIQPNSAISNQGKKWKNRRALKSQITTYVRLQVPKIELKRLDPEILASHGISYKDGIFVKKSPDKLRLDNNWPSYDGAADLSSSDSENETNQAKTQSDQELDVTVLREEQRICVYSSTRKSTKRESLATPKKRKHESDDNSSPSPKRRPSRVKTSDESSNSPCRSPNRTSRLMKSPGRITGNYSPLKIIVTSPKVRKEIQEPGVSSRPEKQDETSLSIPPSNFPATPRRRKNSRLHDDMLRNRFSNVKSSLSELGETRVDSKTGPEGLGELDEIQSQGEEEPGTVKSAFCTITTDRDISRIRGSPTSPKNFTDVRKKLVFAGKEEEQGGQKLSQPTDKSSKNLAIVESNEGLKKLQISRRSDEYKQKSSDIYGNYGKKTIIDAVPESPSDDSFELKMTATFESNETVQVNESRKNLDKDSKMLDPVAGPSRVYSDPISAELELEEIAEDEKSLRESAINEANDEDSDDDVCNVTFTQYVDSQIEKMTSNPLEHIETEVKCSKRITITPQFKTPNCQEIIETMETYGLPKCRNQEPFFSEPADVPKQKELAQRMLKVPGKSLKDLPKFVSSVEEVTGLARWRKMMINELRPELAKSSEENVKLALASNDRVIMAPLVPPPSQRDVKNWLRARKHLAKTKEKRKEEEKSKEPPTVEIQDENVEKKDETGSPNASDLSLIEPSPERTFVPNESLKSQKISLQMKLVQKELFKGAGSSGKPRESIDYSPDSVGSDSTLLDPSLLSALEKSKLLQEQKASRHLGVSCGQIEFLSDSTRSNVANENLQNAKALTRYQYLTIMCLEVFVETRGDLLPDAHHDALAGIFYSVHSDVPPTSRIKPLEHGVIVLAGTEKTKNKMYYPYSSTIPWTISFANTEEGILNALVDLVTHVDPEILIGWELETLSWGYVFQRATCLGIDLSKRISRIPTTQYKWDIQTMDPDKLAEVKLPGRIVLDIWRLMRHEAALLSYTFENVMHHVMHERIRCPSFKTLTEWWNLDKARPARWRVVEHFSIRVLGIFRILDQLDIIGRTSELARLFGIQFFEVFSRGSQFRVESVMLRLAKPLNYIAVSPTPLQRASMRAMEALPLILEPESMLYSDPVIVLDFQSLYPSIIIAHNYCFSTCLGRIEHIGQPQPFEFGAYTLRVPKKTALRLQGKVNYAPCGVAYVKPEVRQGILPRMLTEILETRFMVKKAIKDHGKDDKTLQRALHSRQMGLKFLANVTYGYTAANYSGRMPCIEVGDSVISKSKETLERAIKLVESTPKWGARVVYGDTDSLFILAPGKSKDEAFVIGNEIADAVTASNPPPIKLKFEKILYPAILQTKKRYCGYMYETPDQETPTYLAKGIETVRRDGCPAVSKILEKTLKILFETKDVSLVKKYVTRQLDKVLRGKVSIEDLAFAKEFRGFKGYKPKACVPALELTRRLMRKDPRAVPRNSERVRYVIVAGAPNQALIHCVRTPWELMDDPGLRPNAIYYVTRVIIPPLNRCLNLMGVDVNAWYREMPHRQILNNPVGQPIDKQKLTIFQYFGTIVCVSCGQPSNKGICADCLGNPADTLVVIHEKVRSLDRANSQIIAICQSCVGHPDTADCASLDCPILYRRAQTRRELSQVAQLRDIVECGNSLDF